MEGWPLVEASIGSWSMGAADLPAAFLNAQLIDGDDGFYIVKPPQ